MADTILVVNAGSSSIKFELFMPEGTDVLSLAHGQVEAIGVRPRFTVESAGGETLSDRRWDGDGPEDHEAAIAIVADWLQAYPDGRRIGAVGHRVVHGGIDLVRPVRIDDGVLERLRALIPLAPLHQPHNIRAIEAVARMAPRLPQVACFDTAFHRGHPFVADTFALPRHFYDQGIRRYGFHGLSYEYVAGELGRLDPKLASGRVVVAHLGNGASLCALLAGRSIDSTMGFTAVDGLAMGTRTGQIDPGVILHLIQSLGMTPEQVNDLIYKESGLKGLSGGRSDMRDLLESSDTPAKEALDYFVWRIRKETGALSAALGGLDGFVFTAGIGEHAAPVRAAVCESLAWLGVELDAEANDRHDPLISTPGSAVAVRIVPTDEERMIARHALAVLG